MTEHTDDPDIPDNVIPLRPGMDHYDGRMCACGSAWFTTDAICVDQDLHVTGYTLPIRCFECGVEAS